MEMPPPISYSTAIAKTESRTTCTWKTRPIEDCQHEFVLYLAFGDELIVFIPLFSRQNSRDLFIGSFGEVFDADVLPNAPLKH